MPSAELWNLLRQVIEQPRLVRLQRLLLGLEEVLLRLAAPPALARVAVVGVAGDGHVVAPRAQFTGERVGVEPGALVVDEVLQAVGVAVQGNAHVRAGGHQIPVVTAGGVCEFAQAEAILQAGHADIIGSARQSLADPDWFEKVRSGHGEAVMVCEYTNYCEALDQKHQQVTCQLWDRKQRDEPGIRKTQDGKRRLCAPAWHPGNDPDEIRTKVGTAE